jgi:hypothetical protein
MCAGGLAAVCGITGRGGFSTTYTAPQKMAAMAVSEMRSFLIAALPVSLGRDFAREKAATACPTQNFMELLILNKSEESERRADNAFL